MKRRLCNYACGRLLVVFVVGVQQMAVSLKLLPECCILRIHRETSSNFPNESSSRDVSFAHQEHIIDNPHIFHNFFAGLPFPELQLQHRWNWSPLSSAQTHIRDAYARQMRKATERADAGLNGQSFTLLHYILCAALGASDMIGTCCVEPVSSTAHNWTIPRKSQRAQPCVGRHPRERRHKTICPGQISGPRLPRT